MCLEICFKSFSRAVSNISWLAIYVITYIYRTSNLKLISQDINIYSNLLSTCTMMPSLVTDLERILFHKMYPSKISTTIHSRWIFCEVPALSIPEISTGTMRINFNFFSSSSPFSFWICVMPGEKLITYWSRCGCNRHHNNNNNN